MTVSQAQINAAAWAACDTFRGVVDPSEYKNYILVFLFLKYLSDRQKERLDELIVEYKGDEARALRALRHEFIQLPEESTFDYLHDNRNADNIGELINQAMIGLQDANRGKLDGVFRDIDFNSERNLGVTKDRNERLKSLINDFAKPDLDLRASHVGNQDVIGNTYEYLIQRFAGDSGKKGGEFYTPAEVSELIAELAAPKPGETIYDPTCGSGSLLLKAAAQVGSEDYSLYGQESNGNTHALCMMNMFLHGVPSARIEWGDTIRDPKHLENNTIKKFDVVVANPPFSLKKWGASDAEKDKYKRFTRGVPPATKGDYAFITHMVESMHEEGGRMVVVVPHGVLFRGSSEGKIREQLIRENLLDAVIGLPPNLFFGTGIPAALLVFKKGRTSNDVLFIDASTRYQEGKNQNTLRSEDIQAIVDAYGHRKEVDKFCHLASVDEIQENEFNLNIPRYVDTFDEDEAVDLSEVLAQIAALEEQIESAKQDVTIRLAQLL